MMAFDNHNESQGPHDNKVDQCCTCNQGTLVLSARQLSLLVASLLLFCFVVFIAGYFLGQKKVLERFSNKVEQESFADKISSSIYALYDTKKDDNQASDATEGSESTEAEEGGVELIVEPADEPNITEVATPQEQAGSSSNEKIITIQEVAKNDDKHYYAELSGFGSSNRAYAWANNLQKRGFGVKVKKRESKTARGKIIVWYQVITDTYTVYDKLTEVVDTLKQSERLKDVRIVTC